MPKAKDAKIGDKKMSKYKWHLILNNASPDDLTKLARKPKLYVPEVEQITTTVDDMTCSPCMEYKMRWTPHKRKTHKYERREAV